MIPLKQSWQFSGFPSRWCFIVWFFVVVLVVVKLFYWNVKNGAQVFVAVRIDPGSSHLFLVGENS